MDSKIDINTEKNGVSRVVLALEQMIDNDELKIDFNIKTDTNSTILALVTLNMWPMTIKGFRLVKRSYLQENDNNSIRLLAPAFPYKSKFNNQIKYAPIFILDVYSIWRKLESKVIEAYYKETNNEQ